MILRYVKKNSIFTICLVVNLLTALIVILLRSRLPLEIPLFYGKPIGQEQLAHRDFLILPSLSSFFLVLFNVFSSEKLNEEFINKITIGASIVITLLSTITTFKIIFLVVNF